MALHAYHGSPQVLKAFLPDHGDEGGACFSASPQVAGCYGAQVHRCDIERARLMPMSIADWKNDATPIDLLKKQGFDGIRVMGDSSYGIGSGNAPEDRTFHHDMMLIWNAEAVRVVRVEPLAERIEFEALEAAHAHSGCRLTAEQFLALGAVTMPAEEFNSWMADLYEDAEERQAALGVESLRLDSHYDFLREVHSLDLDDKGRWSVWKLTPEVEAILGPETEIKLYHMTSTAVLPKIAREGLRITEHDASRHGEEAIGVFLSTVASGPPMEGYARAAERVHGGDSVLLEVAVRICDLQPDPHDEDIASGSHQFVVTSVSPRQIVNLAEVLPSPLPEIPRTHGPNVMIAQAPGGRSVVR